MFSNEPRNNYTEDSSCERKEHNRVLVYSPYKNRFTTALEYTLNSQFKPEHVKVSNSLKELETGSYDAVIDTTTIEDHMDDEGHVSREIKKMNLKRPPRIYNLLNASTAAIDITAIAGKKI